MDAAFKQAAQQRPPIVFGLRLCPLSVGHLKLLLEQDSPLAGATKDPPDFFDFLLAVFICSNPHNQSRRNIRAWWAPLFFSIWGRLSRRYKFTEELQKFHRYLDAGKSMPRINWKLRGRELQSPPVYRLLVMLMRDFHFSEEAALDMPVAKANLLWSTKGDLEGTLELISERVSDLWEFAHQEDLKKLKSEEAKN